MDKSNERKYFWRKTIKHRIVESFDSKCACCGQSFEDCCYDVHHINPEEKSFEVSQGNYNGAKSWLKIRDELKKCVLVCANCHRLIHANLIDSPLKSNFNEDYYEWDLTNYKQVDQNLIPIDTDNTTICPQCGGEKSLNAHVCAKCASLNQRQFEVSREELKQLIRNVPFEHIGKQFNVSGNAIKKRCIQLGLPSLKKDIKKYTDEEWELI